jgi:hypothetical protein
MTMLIGSPGEIPSDGKVRVLTRRAGGSAQRGPE